MSRASGQISRKIVSPGFFLTRPETVSTFSPQRTRRIRENSFASRVRAVDLNPHIDRSAAAGLPTARELSLAQPLDLVFHPDGSRAYVAAFGSRKVGVLDGAGRSRPPYRGGLRTRRLALDGRRERLYVLNHLDADDLARRLADAPSLPHRAAGATIPRPGSSKPAARFFTMPRSAPGTAIFPAPAAMCSATPTAWPGISATRLVRASTIP